MDNKNIHIDQSKNGCKAISKALWRQPTSDQSSTTGEKLEYWLMRVKFTKEPRTTSKDLQAPLAFVKVYDSEITKKLCKNGVPGRHPGWKTVQRPKKNNVGSSGICWRDKSSTWEEGRAIGFGVKHSISLKIMAAIKQ